MTNSFTYRRLDGNNQQNLTNSGGPGGARRDRTDDLKLAKLPLSQLSYGPDQRQQGWEAGGPGRI